MATGSGPGGSSLVAAPPEDAAALRSLLEGEVVAAAIGLVGCRLIHGGQTITIVETEAYHEDEEACHGYRGTTPRAMKLRRPPGSSYVYLSYGIHRLVNVVTGSQAVASAVLIRGALLDPPPRSGSGEPPAQAGELEPGPIPVPGPGRLGKLLGLGQEHDGVDLLAGGPLRLEPALPGAPLVGAPLASGPRIGITKAVELPWRFAVSGSPGVSRPRI